MKIPIYILAGGLSTRMQQDKATMLYKGKCLIEHVIEVAKQISNEIYILTNNENHKQFNLPCVSDSILQKGSASGIEAMLKHTKSKKNILLSCDMPFIDTRSIEYLLKQCEGYDIAIPFYNNYPEPLIGIYSMHCHKIWLQKMIEGEYKLSSILKAFNVHYVNSNELLLHNPKLFTNFNSKEDIQ